MDLKYFTSIVNKIDQIDFKDFTINQLDRISPDLHVANFGNVHKNDTDEPFTIGERPMFQVYKGIEFTYLDIYSFKKNGNGKKEYKIGAIIENDKIDILRALIKRLVNQL